MHVDNRSSCHNVTHQNQVHKDNNYYIVCPSKYGLNLGALSRPHC